MDCSYLALHTACMYMYDSIIGSLEPFSTLSGSLQRESYPIRFRHYLYRRVKSDFPARLPVSP